MRLDIDELKTLIAIADEGGVTKAASVLSLSQSAISHKVRRLESSIDCLLLRREPGQPLLTDEGLRILSYARRIIALHEEAISSIELKKIHGQVRLGATEGIVENILVPIIAKFIHSNVAVLVTTHAASSAKLADEMSKGLLDIIIINALETDVLENDRVLLTEELVWVESRDFRPSRKDPVPYIASKKEEFFQDWIEFQVRQQVGTRRLRQVLSCQSVASVNNAVSVGLGVTLINRSDIKPEFREVDLGFPKPPLIKTLIRTRSQTVTTATAALIDEITTQVKKKYS